jgi:hypothetical protein
MGVIIPEKKIASGLLCDTVHRLYIGVPYFQYFTRCHVRV